MDLIICCCSFLAYCKLLANKPELKSAPEKNELFKKSKNKHILCKEFVN